MTKAQSKTDSKTDSKTQAETQAESQSKPRANEIQKLVLEPHNNERLANLCGQFDDHLKFLEQRLGVEINHRGNEFIVKGPQATIYAAARLVEKLYV